MRLYFLRHGAADWPGWDRPDDDRPLTEEGRRELDQVGKFLVRLKARPDVILTSPLPRAAQTAEIAATHLRAPVFKDKLLAPGFGAEDLKRLLGKYPKQVLMLVGHEPDFSSTIASLTGGKVKVAKAGVALVEVESGKSELRWLFPAPARPAWTQTHLEQKVAAAPDPVPQWRQKEARRRSFRRAART